MPVVSVLLWATLLTLGWRAAHAKDHGFATPRVQLSFKGKSLAVGVGGGGRVGPQEGGGDKGHPGPGCCSSSSPGGGHQQAAPLEISVRICIPVWLSSPSAPPSRSGGAGSLLSPPSTLPLAGGWLAPSVWQSWVPRCGEPSPQQPPESRQQLDAAPTPPAGINAWELAGSLREAGGEDAVGGKGLNPLVLGLPNPSSLFWEPGVGPPGQLWGARSWRGWS